MKKNKQKTGLIFTGVVFLVLLLLGAYGYSFLEMKKTSENAALVSAELNQYLSKKGTINILKTAVKSTKEERKKIDTYFVEWDDMPDFAKEIESLGKISGTELVITGLGVKDNTLLLKISSNGSFKNTLQLVALIENLPFKLEITEAYIDLVKKNISDNEGGGTLLSWKGNFSIEIFGFIPKKVEK